jgi:hypothetical protein
MTTNHVLQACPLREALRKDIWPNGINLQNQLYGESRYAEDSGVHPTSGIDTLEKVNAKKEKKHLGMTKQQVQCAVSIPHNDDFFLDNFRFSNLHSPHFKVTSFSDPCVQQA